MRNSEENRRRRRRGGSKDAGDFAWLAAAAEVSWRKCEEYFQKADDTEVYYAAISLNPTLKNEWYKQARLDHDEKRDWINTASNAVKELWQENIEAGICQAFDQVHRFPPPVRPVRKKRPLPRPEITGAARRVIGRRSSLQSICTTST
jgi:hypothetical protein